MLIDREELKPYERITDAQRKIREGGDFIDEVLDRFLNGTHMTGIKLPFPLFDNVFRLREQEITVLGGINGVSSNYELHMKREDDNDEMEIKFEPDPNVDKANWAALSEEVGSRIREVLKVRMAVTYQAPESLPRYDLKTKRVFDHRPKEFRRALDR